MLDRIKKQAGFSIMEVMVVFVIINIGLVGVMSLVVQNIKASSINKYELIASYLAQEGIELVKNVRDENWLNDYSSWKTGNGAANNDIIQDLTYTIDRVNINSTPDNIDDAGTELEIYDNFYQHSTSGGKTPFSRLITVVVDNVNYIEVESLVQWQERGRIHNYNTSVILYDWR